MINMDFFRCDNRLKYDSMVVGYKKLLNEHINLVRQINNQKELIIFQKEKIKNLSRQINFLNRAIYRYKHEKNS